MNVFKSRLNWSEAEKQQTVILQRVVGGGGDVAISFGCFLFGCFHHLAFPVTCPMVQSVPSEVRIFTWVRGRFSPTRRDISLVKEKQKKRKKIYMKESQQQMFQQSWKVSVACTTARTTWCCASGVASTLLVPTASQLLWSVLAT